MGEPIIRTRREFLRATALAAGAMAAAPVLGGLDGGPATAAALDEIVETRIHPAIGIARVGNSVDSFYFGPEVPGTVPRPRAGFKDASGAIARQAARFRLYGYDRRGRVVRELTAADADITWTVSAANAKAAWYRFNVALDLPIATPVGLRNASVVGGDRAGLVIAPGAKTIGGREPGPVALTGGSFLGTPVGLGELLLDERGRLVVLPGPGEGVSPGAAPLRTFSDNDGWADDTCDGPVHATVRIGGRTLEAAPAWLAVTPPNYGPALASGVVTAYDSARTAWEALDPPGRVGFGTDILPVLARLVDLQWVNTGFLRSNGWGTDGDFLDPDTLEVLARPGRRSAAARRAVFEQFRAPPPADDPDQGPQIYGDGVTIPGSGPYQLLAVTPIQYAALERWADGDFVDDRGRLPHSSDVDDLPLRARPAALDRAALDECLGGAFHPGIELPWALRVPSMWATPGRLRVAADSVDTTDYGSELTPEAALAPGGPLDGATPGCLTRWLGTPWQSDAGSCRSGYEPDVSPVLPTFWPARIPNHVLRESDYDVVVDERRPMSERRAAFRARYDWERFVAADSRSETLANMMQGWWKLGMVQSRPGPGEGFPRVLKVEADVGFEDEPTTTYGPTHEPKDPADLEGGPVR
jgi:hypothetical protein